MSPDPNDLNPLPPAGPGMPGEPPAAKILKKNAATGTNGDVAAFDAGGALVDGVAAGAELVSSAASAAGEVVSGAAEAAGSALEGASGCADGCGSCSAAVLLMLAAAGSVAAAVWR